MKVTCLLILISFAAISLSANSQTTAGETPAARQEIIDWLNQKFSLYTQKNADFPDVAIATIKFDGCNLYGKRVFVTPDGKMENITINLSTIYKIEYLDMDGGMIYINFGENTVYIAFNGHKEPDILTRIRNAVDYLKTYCATN